MIYMKKIRLLYDQHILPLVYDYSMSMVEAVQKLVKAVNDISADFNEVEEKTEQNTDNITAINQTITSINNSIVNINNEISDIMTDIENLPTEENIEELRSDIEAANIEIQNLNTRVTVLESQNYEDRFLTDESRITQNENDIDDLTTAVQGNTSDIQTINSTLLSVLSRLSTVEIDISNINLDLTSIHNSLTDDRIDIDDLLSRMRTVESNITSIGLDIATIQGDISTINSNILSLQNAVSSIQGDISQLQTDVSNKSSVSINKYTNSGDNIADLIIDGVTTKLYAPNEATDIIYDDAQTSLGPDVQTAIDRLDHDIGVNTGRISTLEGDILDINTGFYNSDISSVSVASSTSQYTDIYNYTFQHGTYLVIFTANFANNSTGYRAALISGTSNATGANTYATVIEQAANGTATRIKCVALLKFNSATTQYFEVRQNSTSNLNVSGNLRFIKLNSAI